MTSNRGWYFEYEEFNGGMVYLGDDSHLDIFGCGKFLIMIPNGRVKRIISVMFHIDGLK